MWERWEVGWWVGELVPAKKNGAAIDRGAIPFRTTTYRTTYIGGFLVFAAAFFSLASVAASFFSVAAFS